ncbi:FHA domain-containing protein [Aliikangiella coralliicola]|uniref:FHA domain-containing protein n=1 Tax=Aliikangiella coralliicola TaxID=2592383 RepID=A0A545UJY4_9GAMM|nr:FHA domain-containing protein [Aliikangiella coralliicola]TQV89777.1 FHA domain-containing protein [Aliikangiella coralliicola]
MLKIQFKDRRKPAIWLVDSTFTIGSDPGCDIVVDEDQVDPQHVELVIQQDEILLKNVSAKRSVFINEVPVVNEHQLVAWDIIRLGTSELEIIDPLSERTPVPEKVPEQATVIRPSVSPWMLKAISPPLDGQYFSLANGFDIGREKSCDVLVPLSYVSRKHAKFALRKDKLYIEDLNSSNGTYVNGERIKSCELRNGDELRLDEFIFSVIGPVTKVESKPRTIVREKVAKPKKENRVTANHGLIKKSEASHKVFLHGMSPDVQGKIYEITKTQNHISRMLGHHLSTSERSVSARHVYLQETDLGWQIKNDGAADGLMVNGKMQARSVLQDGDELVVGGTLLKFQCVGDKPLNYAKPSGGSSGTGKAIAAVVVVVVVALGAFYLGLFG